MPCVAFAHILRRSPYGERGLKCFGACYLRVHYWSLSLRRAWIEISADPDGRRIALVALLTESVD